MNLWKKTLAFAMCLGLSFSMFACQPTGDSSSASDTGSVGGTESVGDSSGDEVPADAESFFDVVQTAKSANIKVEIDVETTSLYEGEDKFDKETIVEDITLDIDVSENASGGVNAKIVVIASSSGVSSDGTAYNGDAIEEAIYVIDNYVYTYNAADDYYTKEAATIDVLLTNMGIPVAEVQAALDEALGALEDAGITTDDLTGIFEGEFDASAKIEEDVLTMTVDLTDGANDLMDYLATLDETTIVGDVVNDILGLIDPTLSYAAILDKIAPLGEMTVSEAYTDLDEAFTLEMGVGIQDYKDIMIMNASVISALKDAGLTTEDIQAISAFSFEDDLLTPYGEYTLNAFIVEMFAIEDAPEDLIGEACGAAKEYLSTATLGELEVDLGAEGALDVIATISQIDFSVLEEKFGVKYDDDYKVEAGIFTTNIGIEMPMSMVTSTGATLEDKNEAMISVKVTVSELSEATVVIALEEGKEIVTLCYGCGKNWVANEYNLEFREDFSAHICDGCYPTYIYECCWDCGVSAEDVVYRDDLGYCYCEECYAAYSTEVTE